LTASLLDVFEAKLVFRRTGAAALPLHGDERPEGGKPFSDQALAIRAIKCHKGIWWMPWR
jgi:hypothetical protein